MTPGTDYDNEFHPEKGEEPDYTAFYAQGIWVTKGGAKIPVTDMDDGHLVNTTKMLRRISRAKFFEGLALYAHADNHLIGEHARDLMEDGFSQFCETETFDSWLVEHSIFDSLLFELVRRGLLGQVFTDKEIEEYPLRTFVTSARIQCGVFS